MSKKDKFIKFVEDLVQKTNCSMDEDVKEFFDVLKNNVNLKVEMTDNGKMLLKFLQENTEKEYYKSKDIADALGISGRTVSGSMRKLVTDGYVDKIGENPIIYAITEKGKNYKLD